MLPDRVKLRIIAYARMIGCFDTEARTERISLIRLSYSRSLAAAPEPDDVSTNFGVDSRLQNDEIVSGADNAHDDVIVVQHPRGEDFHRARLHVEKSAGRARDKVAALPPREEVRADFL